MKRILPYVFLVFAVGLFFYLNKFQINAPGPNLNQEETEKSIRPSVSPTVIKKPISKKSILIPYWSLTGDLTVEDYDKLIYFGISPAVNGQIIDDAGLKNLEIFIDKTKTINQEKILTVRMIDSDTATSILKNSKSQEKLIENAINIAKDYRFDGVALDLELFNPLNSNLVSRINNFVQQFHLKLKNKNLKFTYILYGDIFYRKRPFDVKTISGSCDELMVMAYDFHKSRGEPGPNFPYDNRAKYGYDFQLMIDDLLKIVPSEKLTIIFGMFGYDWTVDEKGRPTKPAQALTLNEIKKKFLDSCQWKDCLIKRNNETKETEISYVVPTMIDDFASIDYHVVWFEDKESVEVKKNFLEEKGIDSISYWAHSYY